MNDISDDSPFAESAIGALLGCAVGDAVGELAFAYRERSDLMMAAAHMPLLRYTDDTAMAIALAESLIAAEGVDTEALGETFARHYAAEPTRGYGPGPPAIFAEAARTGASYTEAARSLYGGEGSFGNGAAMRIAPLGVAFHADSDTLYTMACRSAAVTHAHPIGQDGAAVLATAVALATAHHIAQETIAPKVFADRVRQAAQTALIEEKMAIVEDAIAEDWPATAVADAVGRSVAVPESMPFAVYAFLQTPEDSLACLNCAVLNGGDRDTLGAMALSIAGAYLGPQGLRKVLINRLEGRDRLIALGWQLAKCFGADETP